MTTLNEDDRNLAAYWIKKTRIIYRETRRLKVRSGRERWWDGPLPTNNLKAFDAYERYLRLRKKRGSARKSWNNYSPNGGGNSPICKCRQCCSLRSLAGSTLYALEQEFLLRGKMQRQADIQALFLKETRRQKQERQSRDNAELWKYGFRWARYLIGAVVIWLAIYGWDQHLLPHANNPIINEWSPVAAIAGAVCLMYEILPALVLGVALVSLCTGVLSVGIPALVIGYLLAAIIWMGEQS